MFHNVVVMPAQTGTQSIDRAAQLLVHVVVNLRFLSFGAFFKHLRPMDDRYNVDPKQHRESIKKLATLAFENLVMGHGTPILGGASKRVRDLAARL